MHKRDMVIAANDIAQRTQPLLNALDSNLVGNRVSQVLQLLVGGASGDEQALAVAGRQSAHDACAGNGRVADGNHVLQLGFEDGVEVFRGANRDEGVRVGQGGEDADSTWWGSS